MRQVGDRIYTINEEHQFVRKWKILEINGDVYRCQNKRTDKICEFSERDTVIFSSKEEARKVIQEKKNKKNRIVVVFFLLMVLAAVAIVVLQMLSGYF